MFGSADDVERDRLMRVAAEASHFEVTEARVECIAKRGRWLRWSHVAEHPVVPRDAGELIRLLADMLGALG